MGFSRTNKILLILIIVVLTAFAQMIANLYKIPYKVLISLLFFLIIIVSALYLYKLFKMSNKLNFLSKIPHKDLKSKYELFQSEKEILQHKPYLNYISIKNFDDIIQICGVSYSPMIETIIIDKIKKNLPDVDIYEIKETTHLLVATYPIDINVVLKEFKKPMEGNNNIETFNLHAKVITLEHSAYENKQLHEIIRIFDYAMRELEKSELNNMTVNSNFIKHMEEEQFYQLHLEAAIRKQEIISYFQPKYNPKTNEIVGAEALSRWIKEDKIISPGNYIYIAEATGLIYDLDIASFENACSFIAELSENKLLKPSFKISTNLSAITLRNLEANTLYDILNKYQVNPKHLSVEITESIVIDYKKIKPLLVDIHKFGLTIEIDDFTAGNSSLTVLGLTQASYVKVDQAVLPEKIDVQSNEVMIYIGLVELLFKLGFHVVAEGVETKEQLEFVKSLGVEIIQGYFYSKPINKEDFKVKLKTINKINLK